MLGGSVNLICVVVGVFMFYVKWMMGVEEFIKEDEMLVGCNVLEFSNVVCFVNYICVVIFLLGMIEVIVQVIVKVFLKFLIDFVVIEIIVISVIFIWDFGNLEFVIYYGIQYCVVGMEGFFQEVDGVVIICYSIGGFSFFLEYVFCVLVVNSIG